MLENLDADPVSQFSIRWKGEWVTLQVYKISIKHLRFNLFNTRIKPHLLEHIAKNSLGEDHFTTIDKDSLSTQRMINDYLRKNSDRKDALKFFKKPKNLPEIQAPLVSTTNGRVLNGNQRLCVFRELFDGNPTTYEHLQTAFVAFLPDNGTAEDERNLEATFQETKLAAVPFDWIQSGLWAVEERKKNISPAKIGKTLGLKENEVNFEIQRINLAREFLIHDGKTGFWHTLRDMGLKQAFKTLAEQMNTLSKKADREKLKSMSFSFMVDPKKAAAGTGKSVHLLIIDLVKNLDRFKIDGGSVPDTESKGQIDDLLLPSKKDKKETKKITHIVDLETIGPSTLIDLIVVEEDIRKSKHQAGLDKSFARRQLTSSKSTF
jgi:hypothetical protein